MSEPSYVHRGCRHMSICDSVVPDTRLEAITEAWTHIRQLPSGRLRCQPVLAALLDELIGDTDG